jgi:inhibitor of cysteine peptidase
MKKLLPGLAFPVLVLLLTACAGQSSTPIVSPPDIPPTDHYVLTDPSVPLEVTVGDEFYIAVPSNPTTGYHWQVMNSWDPKVMLVHATEYQSTSPKGLVGGGGMDIWRFDAVGPGEAIFTISYFPPSNTDTPEQTMTFTVKVK